jgi:IclR family acetate operon transcriptional repressor
VRELGWARAVGEREPDLTAIAAPVFSSRGEREAIAALQGLSSRFDEQAIVTALPTLIERAEAISRELGWAPAQ